MKSVPVQTLPVDAQYCNPLFTPYPQKNIDMPRDSKLSQVWAKLVEQFDIDMEKYDLFDITVMVTNRKVSLTTRFSVFSNQRKYYVGWHEVFFCNEGGRISRGQHGPSATPQRGLAHSTPSSNRQQPSPIPNAITAPRDSGSTVSKLTGVSRAGTSAYNNEPTIGATGVPRLAKVWDSPHVTKGNDPNTGKPFMDCHACGKSFYGNHATRMI